MFSTDHNQHQTAEASGRRTTPPPPPALTSKASTGSLFGDDYSHIPLPSSGNTSPPASPDQVGFQLYSPQTMPRINFEGSWLDLESDSDDDALEDSRRGIRRSRRKSSNPKDPSIHSHRSLANIRELKQRGSMHIRRKLAGKGSR
ncbi:hypothetical protein GGF46_005059 [Coemansia sp. RSA 552]|nr:hypothetical protein GGF46_005059 [Coemansia sp. RSA 552]